MSEASRLGRVWLSAVAVLCGSGAEEHRCSFRERQRREQAKEWGEAPDAVVLVSEANESSSELVSDGVLIDLLPGSRGLTARFAVSPHATAAKGRTEGKFILERLPLSNGTPAI